MVKRWLPFISWPPFSRHQSKMLSSKKIDLYSFISAFPWCWHQWFHAYENRYNLKLDEQFVISLRELIERGPRHFCSFPRFHWPLIIYLLVFPLSVPVTGCTQCTCTCNFLGEGGVEPNKTTLKNVLASFNYLLLLITCPRKNQWERKCVSFCSPYGRWAERQRLIIL